MSSKRSLYWSLLSFVGVLGVAGGGALWLGTHGRAAAPMHKEGVVEPMRQEAEEEVRFVGDTVSLETGRPIERKLNGGEGHLYELSLEAGQFAHLVVEQKRIDVAVRLVRPDGTSGEVDSPNWRLGREILYTIAEAAGLYRVEVISEDPAVPPGGYEIRLEELRAATEDDRACLEGWRAFRKGEKLRKVNETGKALEAYRETLPLWTAIGDREWIAETQYRIGWILQDLGRLAEALEPLQAAQPILRGPGRRVEETLLLRRIGESLSSLGRSEEAVRVLREALAGAREIRFSLGVANTLNLLGNVQVNQGEVETALDCFRESLALARSEGFLREESLALHGQGMALLFLGKPEQALADLRQALAIQEQIDGFASDRTEILRHMADALLRLERLDESRQLLDRALAMNRSTGDAQREITLLTTLGTVHLRSGRREEARQSYARALEASRATRNRFGEAFALLNLGRFHYDNGDPGQALVSHEAAEEVFQAIRHRRGEVSNSFGMARALHRLGRDEEALKRLERIPPEVEMLRSASESPDSRSSYLATKQLYYDLYIDVLMDLHEKRPDAEYDITALEIHEQRRARGLLDLLAEAEVQIRQGVDPDLLAREKDVLARINRQQRTRDDVEEGLLRELDAVRAEIRKKSPRYASLTQPQPLAYEGMRALLPEDGTIFLIYSLGEEHSYLWCVGKEGRVSRRLPSRSWIEDQATQALLDWSQPGRRSREERGARALSQELLGRVAHQLGSRRLVIVADGALQGLPFGALPDPLTPEEPLLARHEIAYLPSTSVLAVLRRELHDRWPAQGELAMVADPVFSLDDPRLLGAAGKRSMPRIAPIEDDLGRALRDVGVKGLERLPYTDEEARKIGTRFAAGRSRILLGFEASRERVLSGELKGYRVLHFATHGVLNPRNPELSGLVLSLWDAQGRPRDGFLLAQEIYNLELSADLVVLSACQTGVGRDVRGEGILGLTRSFMYAGAPRIVVSLWKVSDRATAELMDRFYQAMREEGLTPAQALRCAQLSMRGERADPFLWAGFIFQGEWSPEIPPDDSIETPVVRTRMGGVPDDDLPPPGDEDGPPECPNLGKPAERP